MRLFVLLVICAAAACSLYGSGSGSITREPLPDAGNHNCGDSGGPLPDAGVPPDGYWIDDAPNFDGGPGYLPDAYIPPVDAAHVGP